MTSYVYIAYILFALFVLEGIVLNIYRARLESHFRKQYPVIWKKLYKPGEIVFTRWNMKANPWEINRAIANNKELSSDGLLLRQATLYKRIYIFFLLTSVVFMLYIVIYGTVHSEVVPL